MWKMKIDANESNTMSLVQRDDYRFVQVFIFFLKCQKSYLTVTRCPYDTFRRIIRNSSTGLK